MEESEFNVVRFLQLPTDIRIHVYKQWDRELISLENQDTFEYLTKHERKRQQRILKYMYPIFQPYLTSLHGDSFLLVKWLQLALWLRYDPIVLDCLRLNLLYDGLLLGSMKFITLDGKLQLALGNPMLQVWYSVRDYQKLIKDQFCAFDKYRLEYGDDDFNYYIGLDLGMFSSNEMIITTINHILRKKYNNVINHLTLVDLREKNTSHEEDHNNNLPKRRKRLKLKWQLSPDLKLLIDNLKLIKHLQQLSCHGEKVFHNLINSHGLTNRGSKTINQRVKRLVTTLSISEINNINHHRIVDLSQWENVQQITFSNIDTIDFNTLIVPTRCVSLTFKNVREIIWWDFMARIKPIAKDQWKLIPCDAHHDSLQLQIIDEENMDPAVIFNIRKQFWKHLPQLTEITFYNIKSFDSNHSIIIPQTLYINKRVHFFKCGLVQDIILI